MNMPTNFNYICAFFGAQTGLAATRQALFGAANNCSNRDFIEPGWLVDANNEVVSIDRIKELAADGWDFAFEYDDIKLIPAGERHISLRWCANPICVELDERISEGYGKVYENQIDLVGSDNHDVIPVLLKAISN